MVDNVRPFAEGDDYKLVFEPGARTHYGATAIVPVGGVRPKVGNVSPLSIE